MSDTIDLATIRDSSLAPAEARELLAEIDSWCARTGTDPKDFSCLAIGYPGFVGLLRKRHSARARSALLARELIARFPDGVPDSERALVEAENAGRLLAARQAWPTRNGTPPAPAPTPAPPEVPRDPCWRCGVRGEVGCAHR